MPNLLKGLALKIWLPFSSLDPDLDIELNLELFLDLDFEMDLDFDLILDLDRETSSWPVFMLISRNNCFSVWHLQRWSRSSHYLWFYFCKLMFSLFLVSFFNCFSHDFASFLIVFCTILQLFFTVFRIIFDRTISNMLFLQQLQTNWILKHDMNCTCKNAVHI